MNPNKLMEIIGGAEEDYVRSALETRERKRGRRPLRLALQAAAAAVIILSLTITAFATDFFGLRVSVSDNHDRVYTSFRDLPRVMEEAGFQVDAKEEFSSGYTFKRVDIIDTRRLDENGNEEQSFTELGFYYKNAAGHNLLLFAQKNVNAVVTPTRQIAGVDVEDTAGNYRIYSMAKAGHLTEEDETWQKQPGNFIGYGSNAGDGLETRITTLRWVKDGVYYHLLDSDGTEELEVLYSIVEELIGE